jgi:fatty-acid desaturase
MALFVVLTLVGLLFSVYYLFLQYFVLLVEILLFVVLFVLNVLQLIIGFFACWQFQSYEKQQ